MSEDDISKLMDFGLTSLQSRAYLALLRLGTARASQVSSTIGIVRPEAYRVLRELSLKGLVERNPGLPSTYTARPPKEGVSSLLHAYTQKVSHLEQKKLNLIHCLSSYTSRVEAEPRQRFSVVIGGANVISKMEEMIATAKSDCVGIMSRHGLRRLNREWASAAKRDVRVRLIAEIDASNIANADLLSRHIELRRSRDVLICFKIVDKKEMVLGPPVTDEEASRRDWREDDLWTNNLKFIGGMHALFERLWKTSPRYVPSTSRAKTRQ
jgi:sugar-specific transcriptional regulator TrmB